MFRNAKVGDKVFDICFGWGTVRGVYKNNLSVSFDPTTLNTVCYALNGMRMYYSGAPYKYPTLFWDEVVITPPPKPKKMIKHVGWITIFPHYDSTSNCTRSASKIFDTEIGAKEFAKQYHHIAVIPIEWEEEERHL